MSPPRLTMTYQNPLLQHPPPLKYRIKKGVSILQYHWITHFVAKSHWRKSAVLCAQEDPAPKPQVSSASTVAALPKLISRNVQHLFPNQLQRAQASGLHTHLCVCLCFPRRAGTAS